ncbi:high-affinity Zn transporter ZRT1 [Dipodascopsis uninucleata]
MSDPAWQTLDPDLVTVGNDSVSDAWKVCVIDGVYFGGNEYNGNLGARISSVFVILFVSTGFTLFPIISKEMKSIRIPLIVYTIARNFGTGVIVATAFVHLMDPAYGEIGPSTCIGRTGNWAVYSWPPAIILVTVFVIFAVDLYSAAFVERRFGVAESCHGDDAIRNAIIRDDQGVNGEVHADCSDHVYSEDQYTKNDQKEVATVDSGSEVLLLTSKKQFESEIAAFLVLEFGVVFHSVMIGLNLGTAGDEFKTLYPVIVFHQSFEGLGIGSRLSAILCPPEKRWYKFALPIIYGLTTPISIAIGLGVRTTYNSNSFTVNIVSGVLDSISAGILIYTGLVELLARDFIFCKQKPSLSSLTLSLFVVALGAGIMALLGKWA